MHLISNGGISNYNEENTMDAIMLTKNIKNIEGIKVDVFKTIDDYFVLAKSNDLKEFTMSNKKIDEMTYDEIKKVKFPSHIFKYYIPLLKEMLNKYVIDKKIFLELHIIGDENNYLNKLFELLNNYSYDYYFINNDDIKNSEIKKYKIGKVCNNYIYLDKYDEIKKYNITPDTYIICKNPIKFIKNTFFDRK